MIKKRNIKFILLSILVVYIFIFSDIGIISRIKLDGKIRNYEQEIEQIREENKILQMKIGKLESDYNYIAELARKLGYARPGEKIYRFSSSKPESNKLKITNKKPSFKPKFNIKDYLVYIITFLIVVIIYITLLTTAK